MHYRIPDREAAIIAAMLRKEPIMTALALRPVANEIEQVLIGGDLARLSPEQRVSYYQAVCASVGLNPLTQPFEYLTLNGKLKLYARKDCTDQLRRLHAVSVDEMDSKMLGSDAVYVVTVKVRIKDGRTDVASGAVTIKGLGGENLANALMKAETKAKRRATLSICGLGMLDETEVEAEDIHRAPGGSGKPVANPPAPPAKPAPQPQPPPAAPPAETPPDQMPPPDPGLVDAPTPPAPPVQGLDPETLATQDRLRKMMVSKPPQGLGWAVKHAENWLTKYFGVKKPVYLKLAQARDAEYLLEQRIGDERQGVVGGGNYDARLEQFHAEGRVLAGPET